MIFSIVQPLILATIGMVLLGLKNDKAVRTLSSLALSLSAVIYVTTAMVRPSSDHIHIHSFVVCMVGLCATTLSSLVNTRRHSFATMILLSAISLAFVQSHNYFIQAGLWTLSALVMWLELSCFLKSRTTAQIFLLYHGPSAICFLLGAILLSQGIVHLGVILIVIAILVREFIIPFHSWAPRLFSDAPIGLSMTFIGPQMGVIVLLQLVQKGLMPTDMVYFVIDACALSAVCAAIFGVVQQDARRAIAYIIMSQGALVIFGLEQHSDTAQHGSLLMWHAIALASTGFAMSVGALEARVGPLTLNRPNGNFSFTPRIAVSVFLLGFASIGLPATIGFVAEDLLVQGSIDKSPLLGLCLVFATAINGMSIMKLFLYLFSGTPNSSGQQDFSLRETSLVTVLMALMVVLGLFPSTLI